MNRDTRRLIEQAIRELERLPEAGRWLIWGFEQARERGWIRHRRGE